MVYNDAPRPSDHRKTTETVYEYVFLDNENVILPVSSGAAVTWELYDYYGELVDQDDLTTDTLNFGVMPLGFYTLLFPRVTPIAAPWLDAGGETTFCVVRATSPLKSRAPVGTAGAAADRLGNGFDMPLRGMCGVGPIRHQIRLDNTNYADDKAGAIADIAYELTKRNADSLRPLRQFVAFPDFDDTSEQLTNLADAIPALVAAGVTWFEGKNEPAAEVNDVVGENLTRFTAFANTVHAGHASAKVMGPCPIEIRGDWTNDSGGQARWTYVLLKNLSSPSLVDVISFHNYSNGQGDLAEMRHTYSNLVELLTDLGMENKPRFNTEFGSAFASSNGVCDHRQQGKAIMLDLHLAEQYEVPKEHTYYFYDRSHGFWGFSSWWIHGEGMEIMPTALVPLFRVWGEELYGKEFTARLSFGSADDLFIGSRFTGLDGASVVAIQSSGVVEDMDLTVTGTSTVTVINPWGASQVLPVVGGKVTISVSELPTYVRAPAGAAVNTIPSDWGVEVFRAQRSTAVASDSSDQAVKAMDGLVWQFPENNWIGAALPGWWRGDFPKPTRFNRVTVYGTNPFNAHCTPMEFVVQVLQSGSWITIGSYSAPAPQKVWAAFKQAGANYIYVWWARQNQWTFRLDEAVRGDAIRVYITKASYGGSPSPEAYNQNPAIGIGNQIGLSNSPRAEIREVACHLNEYDRGKVPGVPLLIQ